MIDEFINNFHFLRPWILFLLFLPAFFFWNFFKNIHNSSSWEQVCDKKLLHFLLIKGSSSNRKFLGWLFFLGLVFAILAAAGPTWQKKPIPTFIPENPVMFVLNLSTDMNNTDIKPSRLERTKFKMIDLLNDISTIQSGLIVYTQEPFLITPISDDKNIIINLLPAVNFDIMPTNGNRLDRAINLAVEKLQNGRYPEGNIIIFSSDIGERFDKALEAAQNAAQNNYKVSVLQTSPQSNEKLKLISRYGKGMYQLMTSGDQDISSFSKFISKDFTDLKKSENSQSAWLDMGYYLCFIPLIFCLFFFRRGIFVLLPALFISTSAHAGWFLNNNQEGLNAFNQGDFKTAEQKFEDTSWKAATQYRQGNYEQAAKYYASSQDITSLYNLGNALAKSGKIEEAIKKYEDVLKIEPNHEDAKFNLEYLKKEQEKQQQNQQQNNNQKQNQEQQNQQEKNQAQNDNNQQNQKNDENSQQQDQKQSQADNNQNAQDSQKEQEEQNSSENNSTQSQPQPNNQGNEDSSSSAQPQGQDNSVQNQSMSQEEQQDVSAQPQDKENQPQQSGGSLLKQGDKQDKYDEMRQAKIQQLRQIPENPGGLLKAFIAKEYRLNRYGDD